LHCKAALQAFHTAMRPVLQERAAIREQITAQLLAPSTAAASLLGNTYGLAALGSPNGVAAGTQNLDVSNRQDWAQLGSGDPRVTRGFIASGSQLAGSIAGGQLGSSTAVSQLDSGDALVQMSSSNALAQLAHELSKNMARENAAHCTVFDFLFTRVLTMLQLAKASAVSYPWMPDTTAIVAEGMLEEEDPLGLTSVVEELS